MMRFINVLVLSGAKVTQMEDNAKSVSRFLTFKDGTPVPVDANGEPDFMAMSAEDGARFYRENYEEDAEKQLDSDIKDMEKVLKDAQNAKVKGKTQREKIASHKANKEAVALAQAQLDKANEIRKAMTASRIAESVKKPEATWQAGTEAMNEAVARFVNAPKVEGRRGSITLPNGEKIKGRYVAVPAMSLIPSHDPFNGYKPHEGAPLDEEGHTVNDRDYEHEKESQLYTEEMGRDYGGQALTDVPVVNPDGRVVSGNGRTMAGQLAARNGTDWKYVEARNENAEGFGMKAEDLDKLDHARIVFIPDEPLPYDTATFAKFNRNEKKTQSNTQQAVANSKKLSPEEVGAIVSEIEGAGTLDAFFNNPKAINSLVKTLIQKGVIGQNDVAVLMEANGERLSAQGKELVKNLLLGGIFKEETIRMMGIDGSLKTKALNGIRSVMENMKLGKYSLRDEIDNAIQLLYSAKRSRMNVDDFLRQDNAFEENAREKYSPVAQALAKALEGNVSLFRDLMNEYNEVARSRNTGESDMFGENLSRDELIRQFLEASKVIKENDIKLYGNEERHQDGAGGNHAAGHEEPSEETGGGAGKKKPGEDVSNNKGTEEKISDPAEGLENAADKFKEEQKKRNGQEDVPETPAPQKPWSEMNGEERLAVAEKNPLTEEEIRTKTSEENKELIDDAIDYLNGNKGFVQQIAYLKIYDDVRNRHEAPADDSGAEDGTQLDAAGNEGGGELGLGTGGEGGGPSKPLDSGTDVPKKRGKGDTDDPAVSAGEQGHNQTGGETPGLDGMAAGNTGPEGSGGTGGKGGSAKRGRKGGNQQPAGENAGGKPASKQGTTWRGRTGDEIRQEAEDAKAALKNALKEMLKRGKGSASISLVGLNNEQIEYVPELMKAVKRYGMAIIDKGIYKMKDWISNIREGIHDEMKEIGFSDNDIDDFIKEMWNSKMTLDGESHTIAEWSAIYGKEQLRKALAMPLEEKRRKQQAAEKVAVKVGDRENIAETLPFLLPEQQEDVAIAGRHTEQHDSRFEPAREDKRYEDEEAETRIAEAGNDEFYKNPLRFQIKTPEQRKAAENAYGLAQEHRPDKYKSYAIVDMDSPNSTPEYFEKKSLGDFWRRYYNRLRWGNYKLFNLDKTFDENVNGLKGPFPDEFDTRPVDVKEREKAEKAAVEAQHREIVLRDEVVDTLKNNGLDVSMNTEEGQRMIDEVNGRVRMSAKKRRALETASLGTSPRSLTVVSSANGAKILKNVETLATELDKSSTQPKTFIGDVAKAIGAERFGSGSEYATFETKNGQIVTIRLANHNAHVSGFDHNGRDNGISIVISPKPNEGISNDGKAHIVEFYYDSIKLRRADGKPLAEIVRSIEQALYSGEFKDTTGLAERQEVNADDIARFQKVYQGSQADHVRFFRTAEGEAYGFTVGGKIYIDPRIANSETPIHEYAHLWASALKRGNAKEWKNVVGLMKNSRIWNDVAKNYPELKDDDAIADEVIATYSGRIGAERLRKMAEEVPSGNAFEKAEAISTIAKVKQALDKFWKGVADMLHIHYTTAEEVADRVMKDLLDGVDPRKMGEADKTDTTSEVVETTLEAAEEAEKRISFHKETDEETLRRLEREPKEKVFRAMQVIDGKLYPPMAAAVDGKRVEANELGTWIRADENPDLAIPDMDPKTGKQKVDKKTGELKWKFKLDKGGKDATGKKATDIPAAYNPYWHTSRSPMNDQFKSAWIRPNIVTVECEVPASELSSGYKADRAKAAVGEVDWKSGSVSSEVFKQTGRARKVILSRWCKPVRVLPESEVAERIKEFIGDADVTIPENVVTPKLRVALEKAGMKIGAPEKGVKKSEQIAEVLEKGLTIDNSVESSASPVDGMERATTMYREEQRARLQQKNSGKDGRIVPDDVEKSVSSQIEKKFDEEIEGIAKDVKDKGQFRKKLAEDVERISRTPRSELETELEELKNNQNEEIRREKSGGTEAVSERGEGDNKQYPWALQDRATTAAIERELDYRRVRAESIRATYGLQAGSEENFRKLAEGVEKSNIGKEIRSLSSKVSSVIKRLGVEINAKSEDKAHDSFGQSNTDRSVDYYIDKIVRTSSSPIEQPTTIVHELIHQGVDHAIDLVNSDKAEGVLTPKQIEAVNTILDIYQKAKIQPERFKENSYGLKNEYEFTAQMADPRQRKALELSVWDRVVNFAHELANKGDRSVWQTVKDAVKKLFEISDKDKMDKAIENVLGDFHEFAHDKVMDDVNENDWSYASKSSVTSAKSSHTSPHFRVLTAADDMDRPETESVVESHVQRLGDKLGVHVNMMWDVEDIPDPRVKADLEAGKKVAGWYDEKTGRVYLYMPNVRDTYTAEKTVWHEVVGHKGLRGLMGKDFNQFLRTLWNDLDSPVNKDMRAYVKSRMDKDALSFYDAIEEYLAESAEKGKGEPGFWNNIKNKFSDFSSLNLVGKTNVLYFCSCIYKINIYDESTTRRINSRHDGIRSGRRGAHSAFSQGAQLRCHHCQIGTSRR